MSTSSSSSKFSFEMDNTDPYLEIECPECHNFCNHAHKLLRLERILFKLQQEKARLEFELNLREMDEDLVGLSMTDSFDLSIIKDYEIHEQIDILRKYNQLLQIKIDNFKNKVY